MGSDWNEAGLSEGPAVELLQALGYRYVPPEALAAERGSQKDGVLPGRLGAALRRLNPWISDDNLHRAVRAATSAAAPSLIEASAALHTTLTCGATVDQDLGAGKKGQTVRYFDFDAPERNDLVVTRQLRVQGGRRTIVPDVVLYVNGVPLCVIECKSPTLGDTWREQALQQLARYQELDDAFRGEGAPRFFEPVQLLVATCGQAACYGTVTTPPRAYAEWKTAHPRSEASLKKLIGRTPTPQDVLFCGMLAPANLLDLVRGFVAFEKDPETGRLLRKVCRYQQLLAVNKALDRARKEQGAARGGVIWHTQGSGKSLTMLWLALKLRREAHHQNPTLVIVTDRRDLDEQIGGTFLRCGFPNPEQAGGVRHLRELLSGPPGATVLTTVHKFQELTEGPRHPVLTDSPHVFVLVDEAHRTQYGGLAARMRRALPGACFIGFTGTPIDKKDRSTLREFGAYIDKYPIDQSVRDGATVPIYYEARLPELRVVGANLDALFDRVFRDRTKEEREEIKRRHGTERAIAAAPSRVEAICLDLIEHYAKEIQPSGFKAQVVACSREAAALYKKTLDRLGAPQSAVVYSATNKDEAHIAEHHSTEEERKELTRRFCKREDPLSILVVCDMLITGFDAPIEQVMYLDAPLREHTLLQAIARVNRTAAGKDHGLVVDYWGVSDELQEALSVFSKDDVKGAMTPKDEQLPQLEARRDAAVRFFARLQGGRDLDACVRVLEPEDVRAEFHLALRRFSQSMDLFLPDPRALEYADDLRWLDQVRRAAGARFHDRRIDVSDCGPKVRELIDRAVVAEGVQVLLRRVPLLSPEFEEKLRQLRDPEAQASEMEHGVRAEIHERIDQDPAFYQSLRERLEQIIADRRARRIDAAKQLELLAALRQEMRDPSQAASKLGLSETGFAIFGLLGDAKRPPEAREARPPYGGRRVDGVEMPDEADAALASLIEEALRPKTRLVDWQRKDGVQREMRSVIKRHLRAASYPLDRLDPLAESIVELMKRRHAGGGPAQDA